MGLRNGEKNEAAMKINKIYIVKNKMLKNEIIQNGFQSVTQDDIPWPLPTARGL